MMKILQTLSSETTSNTREHCNTVNKHIKRKVTIKLHKTVMQIIKDRIEDYSYHATQCTCKLQCVTEICIAIGGFDNFFKHVKVTFYCRYI